MQVDGEYDFTAVWVFTPGDDGKVDFKVYKEFSIAASNANSAGGGSTALELVPPLEGYGAAVHSATLTPNTKGDDDDDDDHDDDGNDAADDEDDD